MATGKGYGTATGTATGNANTVLVAAPDTLQGTSRIYVLSIHLMIKTLFAGSRIRVEDSQGGAVLMRMSGATADTQQDVNYTTVPHHGGTLGYPLGAGNALNLFLSDTTTVAVDYVVEFEVR